MITDSFRGDLEYLNSLLVNNIPFSITRFGDGERFIMEGNPVGNGEFHFNNDDSKLQQELIQSFQLNQKNYFVGVPCPCCQPKERCDWMKRSTYLPDEKLTWANIFVNGNFEYFNNTIVPSIAKYSKIVFVGRGTPDNLPFKVTKFFQTSVDAHKNSRHLLTDIAQYINEDNIKNGIFLISSGPFANIMCAKLYSQYPDNTFIDIGSVFDSHQGLGITRGYLNPNNSNSKKMCIW